MIDTLYEDAFPGITPLSDAVLAKACFYAYAAPDYGLTECLRAVLLAYDWVVFLASRGFGALFENC